MTAKKTDTAQEKTPINFPHSKSTPRKTPQRRELGLSKQQLSRQSKPSRLIGHWCSRCKGIWYGNTGDCECPQCKNRNG